MVIGGHRESDNQEKAKYVEDLSEKEQLEAMQAWWQENGRYVISGIVLGIALLAGWNYWQSNQRTQQLTASGLYESLLENVDGGSLESAEKSAASLYADYSSTAYAAQARLAMARLYMDKGRDQDAAEVLRALLADRGSPELKPIARLRLARVLLYQNKAEEVIEVLGGDVDDAFAARFSEALGDAFVALGRFSEAAEAYAVAISEDPALATVDRTFVQMKINDLPEPGEEVAVDESLRMPPDDVAGPKATPEPANEDGQ